MARKLPTGQKELMRAKVMEQVVLRQLSLKAATLKLKVSYRQAKRIYRRYMEEGDEGLLHKTLGKTSGKAYECYWDFGPTLAAEKLKECQGTIINH